MIVAVVSRQKTLFLFEERSFLLGKDFREVKEEIWRVFLLSGEHYLVHTITVS